MKPAPGKTLNVIPDPSESTTRKRTRLRRFTNWLLAGIGVVLLKLWYALGKTEVHHADGSKPELDANEQCVFAGWHEQLFGGVRFMWSETKLGRRLVTLISPSVDGDLASNIAMKLRADVVRGSATRSGFGALRALIAAMRKLGSTSYVVTDGPKGPARQSKSGALILARMTKASLIPIACAASREFRFGSWDRFRLPSPFGKTVFVLGRPRKIGRELDDDALELVARELDSELEQLTAKAEELARSKG